jgi:ABC-type antimicrobial peptide transport system permease subunit
MSSGAGFPINDLLRRKLQTGLTITTLTLTVASTLFLLQFSSRLGLGFASTTGTLTLGIVSVFGQFLLFIGVLIFIIGAVLTSISVFLMSQRTRDFALIKATGCPSSLIGGYFTTELLIVTVIGTLLGIVLGFLADFTVAQLVFSRYTLPNLLYPILIFIVFFILAFFFGLRPILKAAKFSALEAFSPVNYYGLTGETKHKPLSKRALTWRIALRSLYRRQSASFRIVFLLSTVFVLLTVTVAGGIVARDTTITSIKTPFSEDTLAIAQSVLLDEYKLQIEKFTEPKNDVAFNYSEPQLAIPETLIEQLKNLGAVTTVDPRLILNETVIERPGILYGETSAQASNVGGLRRGQSIVIGLDPAVSTGSWYVKGEFLTNSTVLEAVIGDSIAQTMYAPDAKEKIYKSNPLLESIDIVNCTFKIVGVCVDPTNNGYITYVPLAKLQAATGLSYVNLLIVNLSNSTDRDTAIAEVKNLVKAYELDVYGLNESVEKNTAFLSASWQTIMLLPLASLVSASICLVAYMMLSVDEQHQEFAILRAIGAKPRIIVSISAIQSAVVLLSSFGIGISFGVIITFMILIANPTMTTITIVTISGWMLIALIALFCLSLYPAFKLSKTAILKILT